MPPIPAITATESRATLSQDPQDAHSRDGDQVFQAMVITDSSDRDQFGDEHG
jgi:hypothetical protein